MISPETQLSKKFQNISQNLEEDKESQEVTGPCITLDCLTSLFIGFEVITL